MGGYRPCARRGRAAGHPAQGWDPGDQQALPARARPLLPLSDVRPPAQRPRPGAASAGAASRARGGRLGRRRAAPARARLRRRHRAARPRAHPRLGRGRGPLDDRRPALRRRPLPLLRLDAGLRREAAGLEAPPSAARRAPAHLPHPAAGDRQGEGRLRRMPLVAGDHARPAVRGHAGALRRRVRPRRRGDPADRRQRRRPGPGLSAPAIDRLLRDAARVLCVGIGGGGDVVGALAAADLAQRLGTPAVLGGISWERRPIDPLPGPRTLDEVEGLAERLNDAVGLAAPETSGPGGFLFAESRMAGVLGEPVVLVDPNPGARAVAAGLDHAAGRLGCDLIVLLDVGGDVLAHGDEEGLASPLADAVMLAAAAHLRTPAVLAVFGAGCDGELIPAEVLERVAEVSRADGFLGAWALTPDAAPRLEAAIAVVPTEASAMALRCARGWYGTSTIRGGRRTVELGPVGALSFYLDPGATLASAARLAAAVVEATSLEDAHAVLAARGVRTELAYERTA